MLDSKRGLLPFRHGIHLSKMMSPKTSEEMAEMDKVPYASAVGSLMYAQVCTLSDFAYIVGLLGSYLSNPKMDHRKAAKWVMQYLQRTKDNMLTYRKSDQLEIIDYSDSNFSGCQDSRRSTSGYIYLLARRPLIGLVTINVTKAALILC